MTDQALSLAALNIGLLEAIKAGPAASRNDLAERAGIVINNLNRKLESLAEAGLIGKAGEASHDVALTAAGEQALRASAVFKGEAAAGSDNGDRDIAPGLIDIWPGNPRTQFDPVKDEELAVNIGEKGVLQRLLVRPKPDGRFEVIIGERRRRGAAIAIQRGLQPADFTVPCKVRDLSDDEAEEVAGVENIQREDMHWMDEAKWYLKLSNRLSGAAIERLVGGTRGKRSIQDYVACARDLTPDQIKATYLPEKLTDGRPNPDRLSYVKAREQVGEKKERPALDLSPKLAVALLETIAAGLVQQGYTALPPQGHVVVTRFAKPFTGGALSTLSNDRKLIAFGFQGREVVARTTLTEDVLRWLHQLHFHDDRAGALWKARAAVAGDMQAAALDRDGRYFCDELNGEAAPAPAEPPFAEPEDDPSWRDQFDRQDRQARQEDDFDHEDHEDHEDSSSPRAEPGQGEVAAQPPEGASPQTPAAQPAPELPPMLAIVVLEAAHSISAAGLERGPGTWGAAVLANYYTDARGSQLVQGHKMLAFLPMGQQTLVCLGKAGRDWLAETHGIEEAGGKVTMGDLRLQAAQEAMGFKPVGEGPYSTFWLNPPEAVTPSSSPSPQGVEGEVAAQPAERASAQPPAAQPPHAPTRDPFAAAIVNLAAETRALARCAAALREARVAIGTAASRKLKVGEVATLVALIDGAVEAAAPHLAEGA